MKARTGGSTLPIISSRGTQPTPSESFAPEVVKQMEEVEKLFCTTRELKSSIERECKARVKLYQERYELSQNLYKMASMTSSPNADWLKNAADAHREIIKLGQRFVEKVTKECVEPLDEFITNSYSTVK